MALGRQYRPPLGRSARCAMSSRRSKPCGTGGPNPFTPGRSSTRRWQSDASSPARCQLGTSASASRPINQTNGSPPRRPLNESTVYDGPGRTTSRSDASRPASRRVARRNIRHRSRVPARGAARCPGRAASNSVTSGTPRAARARRAAWRWPRWTGSNVPPRIAFTRTVSPSTSRSAGESRPGVPWAIASAAGFAGSRLPMEEAPPTASSPTEHRRSRRRGRVSRSSDA